MLDSTPFSTTSAPPSALPIPIVNSNPSTLPIVRGRPRSTSVSNGSPSPAPVPFIPSPTSFPDSAPSSSSSQNSFRAPIQSNVLVGSSTSSGINSSRNGWGHKPTSSVPNTSSITEPMSPNKGGRHRRSQSSSPDGFPIIHEKSNQLEGSTSGTMKEWTYPKPSPIPISNSTNSISISERSSPSSSLSTSPHSPSFFSMLNALSSSPNSHHQHFPSSHSALLSGVRSHALPHSPNMDPVSSPDHSKLGEAFDHGPTIHYHPILSNSSVQAQSSPPFGPTSPSHHTPSPLALEMYRNAPSSPPQDQSSLSTRRRSFTSETESNLPSSFCSPCSADDVFPTSTTGTISPPPFPIPVGLDSPIISTRARRGSFGRASPPSPALLYLEEGGINSIEALNEPKPITSISPPRSPPPEERIVPNSEGLNVPSVSGVKGRARSRSFTSERDFAPTPMLPGSFVIPPPVTLPPPPPPILSEPLFPSSTSINSTFPLITTSIPPPPPPIVVEESDRWSDQIESEDDDNKMEEVDIGFSSNMNGRGEVERELSEAESTQMDLGVSINPFLERELSPLGNPEHHEVSSYISSYDTSPQSFSTILNSNPLSLPISLSGSESQSTAFASDEGFSSSPPTVFPPFLSAEHDFIESISNASSSSDRSYFSPESDLDSSSTEDGEENEEDLEKSDRIRRMIREQSVSPPGSDDDDEYEEEERNTTTFGSLGYMDVDAPSVLGFDSNDTSNSTTNTTSTTTTTNVDDSDNHSIEGSSIAIDEETLSALERIFICAKSENAEQRARVAHHLADWLLSVDICEAVEYVLPLLAGLATDSDEIVKEVFSPQIDRIMWHFFSQCPLLELDANHDPDAIVDPSPAGSPVPSRFLSFTEGIPHSPTTSTHRAESPSIFTSTPTSTQKTSPSNTEISEAPKISVTNFTSLLGALLTDQSTSVAKATQASLVRFLCRLKDKPLPPYSIPSSPRFDAIDLDDEPPVRISTPTPLSLSTMNINRLPYQLTADARRVLEDEVVTGIVLGLARLDDEERDGDRTPFASGNGSNKAESIKSLTSGSEDDSNTSSLVLSPEEEELIEDGWLDNVSNLDSMQPSTTVESWGEPMVSFFDDALDHHSKSDSYNNATYSTFSPDGNQNQGDEESAIGKMVSMSLIAAIAAADCLEPEVLVTSILPEVDRMKAEPMFYVRKEAMTALGSLARTLPIEIFESAVLPLHAAFAVDSLWHVRRAACLSLPTICSRLPSSLLRSQVILNIQKFASDISGNVRSGALEVCGELIYLFHEKEEEGGVPEELLNFFLGKKQDPDEDDDDDDNTGFRPLGNALDSNDNPFYGTPSSWTPAPTISTTRDPDRPVMCAFNFPAVALTLGSQKWQTIEPYYASLCQDKADKVRQSLASSMHEITKIIGPVQSDKYLLEPFSWFLRDFAHIQSAILENISTLLLGFGLESSKEALGMLGDVWGNINNWRRREAVARDLAGLGAHFVLNGAAENVLAVLAKAFKDPVAAVREQAVYALPEIFLATEYNPLARSKLWAFLFVFSEDSSYRNRMTYTSCALAAVKKGVTREIFESYFVDALSRLAQDNVVGVRIGVSRAIAEACQSSKLYADPDSRSKIQEILYHLAHSSDREVKNPILEYYLSSSPSPPPLSSSPPPENREGARSRMDMNDDLDGEGSGGVLRTNSLVSRFGIEMDHVDLKSNTTSSSNINNEGEGIEMDIESDDSSSSSDDEDQQEHHHHNQQSSMLDNSIKESLRGEGEGEDVEMDSSEDEVQSSPVFLTRELEGEEEFVEVSRI